MKTATLPAVRVTQETRSLAESVLKKDESLSTFIEYAVRTSAQWRAEDAAFYALALRRSKDLHSGQETTITAEESILRLRTRQSQKQQSLLKKAA